MREDLTYWITLYFIKGMTIRRKNELYIACYKSNPRITIRQLFEDSSVWDIISMSEQEKSLLLESRAQLTNNASFAEMLTAQGYDIIPMDSDDYPKAFKVNFKKSTPTILFTKGNKALLNEPSVAIVGSRNAADVSLQFTSRIAKKCAEEGKVVVSGFAKGVDRMALDSAVEAKGKSIIVLPQGICTFSSGFKQYFKQISQGQLLVLSAFHPNAPWSKELAMARNPYIYGMAGDIYVAQTDDKGGTWSGAIDGLKRERKIFVRMPEDCEKNSNQLLIQKGGVPVDSDGYEIKQTVVNEMPVLQDSLEQTPVTDDKETAIDQQIMELLHIEDMTVGMLIKKLPAGWSDSKMRAHLRKLPFVEEYKKGTRVFFKLKGETMYEQGVIFNEVV